MRRRLLFTCCALSLGAWLLPTFSTAAEAAPSVKTARTTAQVTLSDKGGAYTKVEVLSLAAGAWTVTSDVTAVNFGANDYVRCRLQARGSIIDGGATVDLANRVSGLTDVATLTTSETESVYLFCGHDRRAITSGQFYVDPGATMIAVPGGPISGPGVAATASTKVAQERSTAQTAVPTQPASATVVTRSLPEGTWAVTGNLTAVDFGGADFAECQLSPSAGASLSDSFAQPGVGAGDDDATRVDLEGVVTIPSGGGTISISCRSASSTGMYVDPGATLTATRTSPSAVVDADVSQTTLNSAGGSQTVIRTTTVPAGTWRVRSFVIIGFLERRDFLRCTLMANGTSIDGGATEEIAEDSEMEDVVNTATFTSNSSWTLTLSCTHDDGDTATSGHWMADGGHVVAVNTGAK